jgi:hypothetical protein
VAVTGSYKANIKVNIEVNGKVNANASEAHSHEEATRPLSAETIGIRAPRMAADRSRSLGPSDAFSV